jgi:hypothetical protein
MCYAGEIRVHTHETAIQAKQGDEVLPVCEGIDEPGPIEAVAKDGEIPVGRVRRSLPLASLTARTIGGQARQWVRLRKAGEDERLARELEFQARHAGRYAEMMGGSQRLMEVSAAVYEHQLLSVPDRRVTGGSNREGTALCWG